MLTNTKKKVSRWQALALAALVLTGGSIAVPQAADAATAKTKTTYCYIGTSVCKQRVAMKYKGSATRTLIISTSSNFILPPYNYRVVDLDRGKVLCKGKTSNFSAAKCRISDRSTTLSIEVTQEPARQVRLITKLY